MGRPAEGHQSPGERGQAGGQGVPRPITSQRDQCDAALPPLAVPPPRESCPPWPPALCPADLEGPAQDAGDRTDPCGRRGRGDRCWPVLAGSIAVAAAVGMTAALLAGGHPGAQGTGGAVAPSATAGIAVRLSARPSPSPSPSARTGVPITFTQAEAVLAEYTAVNNRANAQRSGALLATVEIGSSYAIDAGLYRAQQAAGMAPYPAFSPVQATYYIPRGESAARPRWFVVQVANAFRSSPATVASDEYLLFTQAASGGPWRDAVEPYLLPGVSAPQVKVGADGMATAVSLGAASVAVPLGQLPADTAASLNGVGSGQPVIAAPGNLADVSDQRRWQGQVPGGKVTDAHAPAAGADGQEFALRTADGGALAFYTDAAQVTVTAPIGATLCLTVPGFYSPHQALAQVTVGYLDQFAAYDPPAGTRTAPSVVAGYSAITGKN